MYNISVCTVTPIDSFVGNDEVAVSYTMVICSAPALLT